MASIALCPNCGGQKTVSKPTYISGDVNTWFGDTSLYPCPTCDGRGWIRVDSVSQDDFTTVRCIALSTMETAENLMDECVKRADKIKELEAELDRMISGERAADEEIERLQTMVSDTKRRKVLVTAELERRARVAEEQLYAVKEMRDEVLEDWEKKRAEVARLKTVVHELEAAIVGFKSAENGFRALVGNKDLRIADLESQRDMVRKTHDAREQELLGIIDDLTTENHGLENVIGTCTAAIRDLRGVCNRDSADLEMLDDVLEIVNPLIKSGAYAKPAAESRLLSIRMHGLCQTVVQFRRKHNIVG